MSYLKKQRSGSSRVRGKRPMGGLWDFLTSTVTEREASDDADVKQCLQSANANTATLDARAAAIAAWQTTGFYNPGDVDQIWQAVIAVLNSAADAVNAQLANLNIESAQDQLRQALDDVHRHAADFVGYRDAASAARASGGIVNAPGLKTWVVNSFDAASGAIDAAYVVGCTRPEWVQILQKFIAVADYLVSLLKTIVNAAITTGKVVVNAVEAAPDIAKYLLWAALIGGGLLLARKVMEMRSSTHAP